MLDAERGLVDRWTPVRLQALLMAAAAAWVVATALLAAAYLQAVDRVVAGGAEAARPAPAPAPAPAPVR